MANRYWVGNNGTWNASSTTNWSSSSGGAGGASVPTTSDDVIFDANSFSSDARTVTLGAWGNCRSFTTQNIDQTVTFSGASQRIVFNGGFYLSNKVTMSIQLIQMGSGSGDLTTNGVDIK